MFKKYNPNPDGSRVGDCSVRAVSKALNQDWITTYIDLCLYGLLNSDMPSANHVWGEYLRNNGFTRYIVPEDCRTVAEFCDRYSDGVNVIGTNGHVIASINGDYYDTWDSGKEVPVYFWHKEE